MSIPDKPAGKRPKTGQTRHKTLAEEIADRQVVTVKPGTDEAHDEIMRAIELTSYEIFDMYRELKMASPERWAERLSGLEEEVNAAVEVRLADGEVSEMPSHVTKDAIKTLDAWGWRDSYLPNDVYTALRISRASIKGCLLASIYTQTRRGKSWHESVQRWAAYAGLDRSTCMNALDELVNKDGWVIKLPNPKGAKKPASYWIDVMKVNAAVERLRHEDE